MQSANASAKRAAATHPSAIRPSHAGGDVHRHGTEDGDLHVHAGATDDAAAAQRQLHTLPEDQDALAGIHRRRRLADTSKRYSQRL